MFNRRTIFNTKRKISDGASLGESLVKNVRYGGNPEHKRNPGDFLANATGCPPSSG